MRRLRIRFLASRWTSRQAQLRTALSYFAPTIQALFPLTCEHYSMSRNWTQVCLAEHAQPRHTSRQSTFTVIHKGTVKQKRGCLSTSATYPANILLPYERPTNVALGADTTYTWGRESDLLDLRAGQQGLLVCVQAKRSNEGKRGR